MILLNEFKSCLPNDPVTDSIRAKALKKAKQQKLDNRCLRKIARVSTMQKLEASMVAGKARKDAMEIAADLLYDQTCIVALSKADTEIEIEQIMVSARKRQS